MQSTAPFTVRPTLRRTAMAVNTTPVPNKHAVSLNLQTQALRQSTYNSQAPILPRL